MPALLASGAVLIGLVRLFALLPSGPEHRELAVLQSANEIIALVLTVVAMLTAYRLIAHDLADGFECLGRRGGSSPLTFAAGRALAGAAAIAVAAATVGLTVALVDSSGGHLKAEAERIVVLFLNALPLFLLALTLMCVGGRLFGLLAAPFLQSCGAGAAYDRGALSDRFIEPSGLNSTEQLFAWLAPRPLLDPLHGVALRDHSVALQQFPVRQGLNVWGSDLVAVSGLGDFALYSLYLFSVTAVLYLACRRRASQARSRLPMPAWLAADKLG